jgi:predicted nuclease with TOPRIM domain
VRLKGSKGGFGSALGRNGRENIMIKEIEHPQETYEELKERSKKHRVDLAFIRAELVKMEIIKDEADALNKEVSRLRLLNTSLSSQNGKLLRKVEKLEAKLKKKDPNSDQQDDIEAGPDDRSPDTDGDC